MLCDPYFVVERGSDWDWSFFNFQIRKDGNQGPARKAPDTPLEFLRSQKPIQLPLLSALSSAASMNRIPAIPSTIPGARPFSPRMMAAASE